MLLKLCSTKRFWLIVLLAAVFSLGAAGCAYGPESVTDPERPQPESLPAEVEDESVNLAEIQRRLLDSLEKKAARPIEAEPIMPEYDPLANQIVSFSMADEPLRSVLFVLAQAVGMNLIIDPNIQTADKLITLHFEEVPASTVLRNVLENYDLYYEIEDNIIRVKPFQEAVFRLNFLDADINSSFDVGGDVLGAGDTETASGLSGTFRLTGRGAKRGNPYDVLEDMIKPVLSPQGRHSINRLSGALYVKDTPAGIRSVRMLVDNYKEMLSRQIRIEAQIIEVALSEEHRYGIDWSALRDNPDTDGQITSAAWALGTGLVLSGTMGQYTMDAIVNALNRFGDANIVSNPVIRCKHAKPAIISVGTSFTYKKSVKTTTTGTDAALRESTEVDVSTVFDGLILGVIPFIDQDGQITLLINPIKSEVDQASLEPEPVGTNNSGESISLPKIQIKEINTTIDIRSGDAVVLGGLIDKRYVVDNEGVPGLSAIPILGYLFKKEYKREETRELVIVLSVTLV